MLVAASAKIMHYSMAAFIVPAIALLAINENAPILSNAKASTDEANGILLNELRSQIALCSPRL